jgi:hypothetical protein
MGERYAKLAFEKIKPLSRESVLEKEKNVELWGSAFNAVWADLQAVEAKEGPLDPEDPRLTAVKICAMRLDEAKEMLKSGSHDSRTQIEA